MNASKLVVGGKYLLQLPSYNNFKISHDVGLRSSLFYISNHDKNKTEKSPKTLRIVNTL